MQVFGRNVSPWWMLFAIAILVISSPLLLMGFFAANNFAGAILGPPAIWHRPSSSPPHQDMVGQAQEKRRHSEKDIHQNPADLTLRADGTMVVEGLPYEFYPNTCTIAGTGTWKGPDSNQTIDLFVAGSGKPGVCASNSYSMLEITGRSKPYGLYWVIGDPDSGNGVWLSRKRN
jgi:hypothetical protein